MSKIAYIHARPHGHPIHEMYAQSLGPDRFFIDFKLRWHDLTAFRLKRYLSWFLCAALFPNRKKYDVFYADGAVHFLAIMKYFGLITKRQKLIFLMADETLYFLKNGYYSRLNHKILSSILSQSDGFICIGSQQTKLATLLFPSIPSKEIFNAVGANRYDHLLNFNPLIDCKDVITICSIADSDMRCVYKGLDVMVSQMDNYLSVNRSCTYFIYGHISLRIQDRLLSTAVNKDRIVFKGHFEDLNSVIENVKLCLHFSRGDVYPTSTLECALAGIPTIVSTDTGTSSLLSRIDTHCVVTQDQILASIIYFYSLDNERFDAYVKRSKEVVSPAISSHCMALFQDAFKDLSQK